MPDRPCTSLEEARLIAETLMSGGYDGTEGQEGSSDTTWTDFGIVCGVAERFGVALCERGGERRLQHNPGPLSIVDRRDNVTAVHAIRGRSREDRLRVWLALGGTEAEFLEDFPDA